MDVNEIKKYIEKSKRIEQQVVRWDMFAKLAPTIFLIVCFILLLTEAASFESVFAIGMTLFALTAVTWWFWTIFSIRHLVRLLNRASKGLIEVTDDLKVTRKEFKEYVRFEKNNSSKSN